MYTIPSTMHTIIISIVDSHIGLDIMNVTMQSTNNEQFELLINILRALRTNLKESTNTSYLQMIDKTVTIINLVMMDLEGNTAYAELSANFQYADFNEMEEMFRLCDTRTLDINLSYWIPDGVNTQSNPALQPFIETVNNKQIFSVDLHSNLVPNWNEVLTHLEIM